MTVIADWPHVPKQAEVQKEIDGARDGFAAFVLCTPTSIIPAGGQGDAATDDQGVDPAVRQGRAERDVGPVVESLALGAVAAA